MDADGRNGRNTILMEYHTIWSEAWRYFRTYAEQAPLTEDAWDRAVGMLPEFVKRHPEKEEFARKVALMVFQELERYDRAERKKKSVA